MHALQCLREQRFLRRIGQRGQHNHRFITRRIRQRAHQFAHVVQHAHMHQQRSGGVFGGHEINDLPGADRIILRVQRDKAAEFDAAFLRVMRHAVGNVGRLADIGAGCFLRHGKHTAQTAGRHGQQLNVRLARQCRRTFQFLPHRMVRCIDFADENHLADGGFACLTDNAGQFVGRQNHHRSIQTVLLLRLGQRFIRFLPAHHFVARIHRHNGRRGMVGP